MPMRTLKVFIVVFVVTFGFAFSVAPIVEGYKVGDIAVDFKLKNTDGQMVSLADYKDAKGYLVIFTCNTCPYAMKYEERIIALDKKYKEKGVPVVAIMPNNVNVKPGDSFENMQKRSKEKGFTFPYLIDENQEIYPQYGATRTPHVYLLEKTAKGNVVRYIGAIDDNYQDETQVEERFVEDAVDAMLSGEEIPIKTTKAIGCSIKA